MRLTRLHTLAVICALFAGCGKEAPPQVLPQLVRSTIVTPADSGNVATYTAEIRARHEADLAFQVGGKLIARFDVGASVRKGEVLARLDQVDQRNGADSARAGVTAARAELERARADEARYRDLLERGLTTRTTHLAQQTAVRTSQSRLDQALADLKSNEQRVSYTLLRADLDGIVTEVTADVGSIVSAGQRILTVAQPRELEVAFDVPDTGIADVRIARSIGLHLTSDPARVHEAIVREISPGADPVTRTYRVKATIGGSLQGLRLGMTTTVSLVRAGARSGIAVPATALFQHQHDPAVWVIRQGDKLELRPVKITAYDSDRVLLASGLQAGERVVTAGVHRLAVDQTVRIASGAGR